MTHCERCGADYSYDPKHHKCPGVWEAECDAAGAPTLDDRYAGMSWVEEQMAKQAGR